MFTLDDPRCIPDDILSILRANHHVIQRARYFDRLIEMPALRAAAAELNTVVRAGHVRAYHCTKELHPGTFATGGLRTLSIERHISEMLALISRTAPDLENDFRRAFHRRRAEFDMQYREGQIWFCLTRDLVVDEGTEDFFTYYGGEAIYRALSNGDRCLSVLASLGRPVVVEAAVPGSEMTISIELPFARALIGHYAQTINATFQPEGVEGYLRRSVSPSEILRVHERNEFFRLYKPRR